ncbi:hypothetical protein [Legionella worsleiensis]|uniref:Uncharacterized protein n=1 Tax=Legionella worsleiensis TaxID=45076 RepID=A0A0W1ALC0_9GAMM|nr:hypothetical protein [Legionella worsleiensis]KTD82078.1 hypothetical protein Lwor_0381 [Legionella worsleiensis]STY30204.1 Uncharacterised protein [Legionella worsleiensis]
MTTQGAWQLNVTNGAPSTINKNLDFHVICLRAFNPSSLVYFYIEVEKKPQHSFYD